jgi:hypothetical protein
LAAEQHFLFSLEATGNSAAQRDRGLEAAKGMEGWDLVDVDYSTVLHMHEVVIILHGF